LFLLEPLASTAMLPAAVTTAPPATVAAALTLLTPTDPEIWMWLGLVGPVPMFWVTRAEPSAVELASALIFTLPPEETCAPARIRVAAFVWAQVKAKLAPNRVLKA